MNLYLKVPQRMWSMSQLILLYYREGWSNVLSLLFLYAEFIIIHSGARIGCRIEATPLTITDILLNDYCITCNMYVHNYSPPPLPVHRIIKSILIVSLELVPKVLRSSFAKLVIFLKEIAYAAFDLPGALYFSIK